jgi:hypothetical protein
MQGTFREHLFMLKVFPLCAHLQLAEKELKRALSGLAQHLFGDVEMRWVIPIKPYRVH